MKEHKRLQLKQIISKHIINNSKEYIFVTLVFFIGIFLGVMFINNVQENQMTEITTYLNSFIEKLKSVEQLKNTELLKESIVQNILLALMLWFFGTTVIGMPIVFGIIIYRGFCLGYTISAIVTMMGFSKGILFILMALLVQNILFIPAIIAIAVSGFKLYKSIVKDKNKENIKIEILRHTIFLLFMLIVLCVASFAEILISTNLLKNFIKYF